MKLVEKYFLPTLRLFFKHSIPFLFTYSIHFFFYVLNYLASYQLAQDLNFYFRLFKITTTGAKWSEDTVFIIFVTPEHGLMMQILVEYTFISIIAFISH